jgi:hypothetical protein
MAIPFVSKFRRALLYSGFSCMPWFAERCPVERSRPDRLIMLKRSLHYVRVGILVL